MEILPYNGQSRQDRAAFQLFLEDLRRGKTMSQLQSIAEGMTHAIRRSWSARSFTDVTTADGKVYDAVICNISYHYNKHGYKLVSIERFTQTAKQYFSINQGYAKLTADGLLKMPNGSLYERDGRIVTYIP
jgi:hypothetical protein